MEQQASNTGQTYYYGAIDACADAPLGLGSR